MIEDPSVAAVMAVIAGATAWTTRTRLPRAMLRSGAAILVSAWAPLLLAVWLDREGTYIGNGLGLGLLAWLGSDLGAILVALGLLLRLGQLVWPRPRT
jgi:hypothetical protein